MDQEHDADDAAARRIIAAATEQIAAALPALDLGEDMAGVDARSNLTRALNILRYHVRPSPGSGTDDDMPGERDD